MGSWLCSGSNEVSLETLGKVKRTCRTAILAPEKGLRSQPCEILREDCGVFTDTSGLLMQISSFDPRSLRAAKFAVKVIR